MTTEDSSKTKSDLASTAQPSKSTLSKPRRRGGAFFVAAGILLSRIAGLVRSRVMAHYLGNSDAAGAFNAAFRIPNFLQNLFGEGVLSASFIPVYSRLLSSGDSETASRLAGVVLSALTLIVSVFVLFGVWFTPAFVDLVAPGFEGEVRLLTIDIVRILFPGAALLVLSAWCLGVLNSHRKFFLSYVAPVGRNVAMILTLIFFGRSSTQSQLAVYLAWGSVVGSALQLGVQLLFVLRAAGKIKPGLDFKMPAASDVFRSLGPVLFSRGVVQISAYIDSMIASYLGPAAVASLAYAQTLYLLPVSLFGMSVAAAELPEMSRSHAAEEEAHKHLRGRLTSGTRTITVFVVPSVVALVVPGRWIVAALYQTGQFGYDDTLFTWYILIGSAFGLLAATIGRLYSSAFYALRDTRTPLNFAIIRVILTAGLGVLFAFPLSPWVERALFGVAGFPVPQLPGIHDNIGAVGLTLSSGLAGWIEFLLLRDRLSKKIGKVSVGLEHHAKVWAAALFAGALAVILNQVAFSDDPLKPLRVPALNYDVHPLLVIGVFGVAYLAFAWAFGIDEIKRRLRRR